MSVRKSLMIIGIAGFCAVLLFSAGCFKAKGGFGRYSEEEMQEIDLAQRDNLPVPTGGLVLSVRGEAISVDEVIEPLQSGFEKIAGTNFQTFVEQSRPAVSRVVMNKVTDILLYNQAQRKAGDNAQMEDKLEQAVESEVDRFIVEWGGDYAKAQAAIEEMGMDWKSFREYQKRMLLTQSYLGEKLKSETEVVSRRRMKKFYDENQELFEQKGVLDFKLIDIRPEKLADEQVEEGQDRKDAAIQLAGSLYARAKAGDDFGELAEEYSHGHMAISGGDWDAVTPGSLAAPYDAIEEAAKDMEAGELSGPIVADGHVFVMQLEEYRAGGVVSFAEAQDKIEYQLKTQRRREQFNEIIAELMEQANVQGMDRFVEYCLVEAYNRYAVRG
ncbi:peptidylprolyl isomerase [Anaerohalosphaera lusitana]|uniref:peptidylprolyl isomerase n=1 Tax=Anaerohalosphaera lusitana TaxID=1936003 RepID=A0A1U9NJP5_9BACT|nr:peptidyl-prolyl cis-trans isomerase [Anaerohalosphaera lusitana]AQT68153.1 peptidylprolyl isomerase [Anaerohalosphaera lusitana]